MDNFIWNLPTKLYFGKDQLSQLKDLMKDYQQVLLVYGGGSIKSNGIYDQVISQLSDLEVFEFSGVQANPTVANVEQGIALARTHQVQAILAVGGGSVIDCVKVMAAGYYYSGDSWDIVKKPSLITQALPIYVVVTLAATGSEMNDGAVITNTALIEKCGVHHLALTPVAAVMDPSYLATLPAKQRAAGAIDTMAHVFENYFKQQVACDVVDSFAEGILKSVIKYAPIVMSDPSNYDAQANLMLASGMALNGITALGKPGRWSCHGIGHQLSAYYNLTHGVSLGIITPRWMSYILNEDTIVKFAKYGRNVWGLTGDDQEVSRQAVAKTSEFFSSLGISMTLSELGIDSINFKDMAEKAVRNSGLKDAYVSLDVDDVVKIYEMCL